jgi:hypothetical protein
MKYKTQRLDGRFSHRKWFGYYIGFSGSMSINQGPLHFDSALKWFYETYGWSAEIRQYDKIMEWVGSSQRMINQFSGAKLVPGMLSERPDSCNPHWSWTNGYDDLRIYVATEKELAFFQLSHPCE